MTMLSHAEENYMKAIWKVVGHSDQQVSTNAIAALVNTRAASVTDMLKKLSEKKLIDHKPYKGVKLTRAGWRVATQVVRKHRLWEVFLVRQLGYKWDEVHDIAEQLEHIRSESLIEKLDRFLGFPKTDPHGDPIPDREGRIHTDHSSPLSEIGEGGLATMTGVLEHGAKFLQYLDKHKLELGCSIEILTIDEYDLTMEVLIDRRKIKLSHLVTKNILVKKKSRSTKQKKYGK